MSFRRHPIDWDKFLRRHGSALRACGLPGDLVADRHRFLRFLDDGWDQQGWPHAHHGRLDAHHLTDDQIGRLAELVGQLDPAAARRVASRWQG